MIYTLGSSKAIRLTACMAVKEPHYVLVESAHG